jgi:uncharacterized damage-inducible protein DinB
VNEILLDTIRHNNWATKQLIAFCSDQHLTAEQLATTGVGTFGDIPATLHHIVACDGSYVRRLAESPLALGWIDSDESADFARLAEWAGEAAQLWDKVLSQPIDVERVVIIDDGIRAVHAGIFIAQAVNHANHHREQVCAILTGFGIQPPDIQAWEYAWATGRIWDRPTG